ncbi:MAG: type II 3-dehydroquinate dehydratase [Spirochaetota bacterium]
MNILVIHGPNINLLGTREPGIYGNLTLDEVNSKIETFASDSGIDVSIYQSNHEGDIIDAIQNKRDHDGLVINPAAYTHTSVAIHDAIIGCEIPAVEVHISNIHGRETFRKTSLIAPACIGQISGFGYYSYILGLKAIVDHIKNS